MLPAFKYRLMEVYTFRLADRAIQLGSESAALNSVDGNFATVIIINLFIQQTKQSKIYLAL